MKDLVSHKEYLEFILNEAVLIYFSTPECNVCKILKPKLIEFIKQNFPRIEMAYVDTTKLPEVSAQNSIFTVPTICVYLDGKEFIRRSRNINLTVFKSELERPYSLYFNK